MVAGVARAGPAAAGNDSTATWCAQGSTVVRVSDALESLDRHTELLLATARDLDDLRTASLCVGWTRGHVLTHVARNAEGLAAMVRAAVDGTGETMYAGDEQRDAQIEAGARRPLDEQVAEVARTAAELATALRRLGPDHADLRLERTPGGMRVRIGNLPRMRLREVVYHHVDLAAGFTFDDVEPDLLHRFLTLEARILDAVDHVSSGGPHMTLRSDDGETWTVGDGTTLVEGSRAGLLLWLARGIPDGVRSDRLPSRP